MAINLSRDAQQLLGAYQQIADLTPQQEAKLQKIAGGEEPCNRASLEQILDPGCLAQAAKIVKCDPRGDDAIFNTAFVGRPKVEKEDFRVRRRATNRMGGVQRRDPYYAKIEVDPRAAMVVLTSGSKFEPGVDRPRPRLMKLVVRTEAEAGAPTEKDFANLKKLIADGNMRKFVWDPKGDDVPVEELDIQWIGSKTASIETKDVNEPEFDFGSSIVAISQSKDGAELSRANALDPVNIQITTTYWERGNTGQPDFNAPVGQPQRRNVQDQTPPETFDHRIGTDLAAKNLPRGTWIDTPKAGEFLTAKLHVGSRWMMEAGSSGTVTLMGTSLDTKVKEDDVYFTGSHPAGTAVKVPEQYSLSQVFGQNITKRFGRVQTDTSQGNLSFRDAFFSRHAGTTVGGRPLNQPVALSYADGMEGVQATKQPIPDAERNGLQIDVKLGREFIANADRSVKGFTVDAGIRGTDDEGQPTWTPATHGQGKELYKLDKNGCGDDATFCLQFDDFPKARDNGQPIELIVRDPNGLPVARLQVDLDKVNWA